MNRPFAARSRSTRAGFVPALGALALIAALSPAAAVAQADDFPLFDHWSITLGGYFETSDTRIDLEGELGDLASVPIDFEGELGLDGSDTLFRGQVQFMPGERHQFSLGYYDLDREASRRLDRDIVFNGHVFPVSAEARAFTEVEVIEGDWTWWFSRGDRAAFGSTLGLVYLGVDTGIELEVLGVDIGTGSSASTDLPIPVIGLATRFAPAQRLIFDLRAQLLPSVQVGDVDGSMLNVAAGLEFRLFRNFSLGAQYNLLDVDVDVDKDDFRGHLDYRIDGFQAFVRFGF